jgi:tetratricopeptide (TPR) repeat protein
MGQRLGIVGNLALTVLLAAAVIYRVGPGREGEGDSTATDREKQRILEFWQLHREANRLRLEGDLEAAVPVYRQGLELNPGHEDSLYYLGLSLEGIGEYTEAAALYREITQQNALSSRALAQLGQVLSTPAQPSVSKKPKPPSSVASASTRNIRALTSTWVASS